MKITANLFFYSKVYYYICIVRKTTIKFNKTKNIKDYESLCSKNPCRVCG